jgi:hypothetical protein
MTTKRPNSNYSKNDVLTEHVPNEQQLALEGKTIEDGNTVSINALNLKQVGAERDDPDDPTEEKYDSSGPTGFLPTQTRFVEAWIAGPISTEDVDQALRDWAEWSTLECGYRALLFVFPKSPDVNHIVGWIRSAYSSSEMMDHWDRVFFNAGTSSNVATDLRISAPVISNRIPQEAVSKLMTAMMTSVPQERTHIAPFIVDLGDLTLLKSVRIEPKRISSEASATLVDAI